MCEELTDEHFQCFADVVLAEVLKVAFDLGGGAVGRRGRRGLRCHWGHHCVLSLCGVCVWFVFPCFVVHKKTVLPFGIPFSI